MSETCAPRSRVFADYQADESTRMTNQNSLSNCAGSRLGWAPPLCQGPPTPSELEQAPRGEMNHCSDLHLGSEAPSGAHLESRSESDSVLELP